jgi:hypothetical protein
MMKRYQIIVNAISRIFEFEFPLSEVKFPNHFLESYIGIVTSLEK